jgi:site-specific DNA recombinase
MRASTGEQAKRDLSIPDQQFQMEDWVKLQGGSVTQKFIDTGSATNSKRSDLQRMLSLVRSGQADFEVVLVHSFSRFFRNTYEALASYTSSGSRGSRSSVSRSRFHPVPPAT